MSFKISIHFPPNYPYVPPVIKFESPCFHPNVDIASGAICLDILQVCFAEPIAWPKLTLVLPQDKWSAVYSVQTILLSLQSLLGGRKKAIYKACQSLILNSRAEQRITFEHGRIKPLGICRLWATILPVFEPYLMPDFSVQSTASEVLPTDQWRLDSLRVDKYPRLLYNYPYRFFALSSSNCCAISLSQPSNPFFPFHLNPG